ncbi:hypothetical protein INR49_007122 [Caranx melampygus]|nr:hypothetical protein INR49_007122 [Caranx melampygus]
MRLAELAQSDDHNHSFPVLSSPPPARDWSGVSVNSDLGTGTIYRSLASLGERFRRLKNIAETGMRRVQEYAGVGTEPDAPDHPDRFDRVVCVLGREAISSGRHYWRWRSGGRQTGIWGWPDNQSTEGEIDVTPAMVLVTQPQKQVSFYNVDAKIHIYTFKTRSLNDGTSVLQPMH